MALMEDLPPDVLLCVLRRLDPVTLCRAVRPFMCVFRVATAEDSVRFVGFLTPSHDDRQATVSTAWREAAATDAFWERHYREVFGAENEARFFACVLLTAMSPFICAVKRPKLISCAREESHRDRTCSWRLAAAACGKASERVRQP